MKLFGLQTIDGGLSVALPSGQQILMALPQDRRRAAEQLGMRLLEMLDDPAEPHSSDGVPGADDGPEEALEMLDAGLEAGRLVWRTFQAFSRGKGRS